ncbi:pyridoxal phosphate-dependent transferase [Neohortaea acidophila]|uniref:Pyridoxal phosphate-dependent transferase n=1 Tax=Neohortaea acidophila TaxID=245834 RepID=A0A6A6PKJ1_9PEZI|nr:pyridoxal phosphate-dependent transferase [Neohortaea acidophila]KAF2480598.1 pyridoxal phosphate-dependent transferase [Neohortaea acidophila]
MSSKTKAVSLPHVDGRTGLVFPVKAISDLARQHGAFTLLDGAHSAGQIDFRLDSLGCDAYATCLHKWMHGPRGTGFLYIRRDKISQIWPLFATWSDKPDDSIEKFEEVGTVFKALPAAIPDMIAFNRDVGQAEKNARYRYLRHRWASRLAEHKSVVMLTDIAAEPGTCFGAFTVKHMDCETFARVLLQGYDISVKAFAMEEDASMKGIHISTGLANTVQEIDRFVDAALEILEREGR